MDLQNSQENNRLGRSLQKGNLEDRAINLFYSNEQVLTHYGESLSIGDTLTSPSIQSLVKTHGKDYVEVFIAGLLNEFLSFVPTSLSGDEVVLYANKILAYCPTWSTTDLIMCLKNGMDGKYGETKYHWKWTVFVEWAKKYEQQKDDFFFKRHVEKTNNAKMDNADLIKLLPKQLIDQFAKAKFIDQEKRKLLDVKIPKDVVDKGLAAIDEYIEQIRNTQK